MLKLVAIHQPNFFPWLGYFNKIVRSDAFVFLDHVQFPKTGGGVWCNRVKMRIAGEARWITRPIKRAFHGVVPVNAVEWNEGESWRDKMIKTLTADYGRSPYFKETLSWIEPVISLPETNLARYNMAVG